VYTIIYERLTPSVGAGGQTAMASRVEHSLDITDMQELSRARVTAIANWKMIKRDAPTMVRNPELAFIKRFEINFEG
jgi:hypothetical protein